MLGSLRIMVGKKYSTALGVETKIKEIVLND